MTNYVLGFPMTWAGSVALVRKTKPEWQKGDLNGFGGKVKDDETYGGAMFREFREYTSYALPDWNHILFMKFQRPLVSIGVYATLVTAAGLKRISEDHDSIRIAHLGMESAGEAIDIDPYSRPIYDLERNGELVQHTMWMVEACHDYYRELSVNEVSSG